MFASLVRQLVREAHVGEAAQLGSAAVILRIVKEHGPCNKRKIWEEAEAAGVKSLRHTKKMLQWLRKNGHVDVFAVPKSQETKELETQIAPLGSPKKSKRRGYFPPHKKLDFVFCLAALKRESMAKLKGAQPATASELAEDAMA